MFLDKFSDLLYPDEAVVTWKAQPLHLALPSVSASVLPGIGCLICDGQTGPELWYPALLEHQNAYS